MDTGRKTCSGPWRHEDVRFWQLDLVPLPTTAVVGLRVAVVVAALLCVRWSSRLVAQAGVRFGGEPALGGAGWPVIASLGTLYGLLWWRKWPGSYAALGPVLAVLVWLLGLGLTLFVISVVNALTNKPEKDEQTGRRIPSAVVRRSLVGGAVGLCVTLAVHDVVALSASR